MLLLLMLALLLHLLYSAESAAVELPYRINSGTVIVGVISVLGGIAVGYSTPYYPFAFY